MNVEKKLGIKLELLAISEIFKANIQVYFLPTQMDPYIEIETQSTERKNYSSIRREQRTL